MGNWLEEGGWWRKGKRLSVARRAARALATSGIADHVTNAYLGWKLIAA